MSDVSSVGSVMPPPMPAQASPPPSRAPAPEISTSTSIPSTEVSISAEGQAAAPPTSQPNTDPAVTAAPVPVENVNGEARLAEMLGFIPTKKEDGGSSSLSKNIASYISIAGLL